MELNVRLVATTRLISAGKGFLVSDDGVKYTQVISLQA